MQLNFEKLHFKPKHLTEHVDNCKNGIIFRILLCHITIKINPESNNIYGRQSK